jgi:hypothetical protein
MVAAGHGLTLSAPPWLDGIPGIVWRPLSDVQIEIRTAAAWREQPVAAAARARRPAPRGARGAHRNGGHE